MLKQSHGDDAIARVVAKLAESDRAVLTGPIFPTNWYDLELYCRYLHAQVQTLFAGNERILVGRAETGLKSQMGGVYRFLALIASPESFIEKLGAINTTYFQGLEITTTSLAPKTYLIAYRGLKPDWRIFDNILLGWWRCILQATRAKNPKVELSRVSPTSDQVQVHVSWQ